MTPFITEEDVKKILNEKKALFLAQETFLAMSQKKVFMPPKMYLVLSNSADFRAMPAFLETSGVGEGGVCGLKWISVFPQNMALGQPTVIGTILLNSPKTGALKAILEANTITAMRTAAAAALASTRMANPEPKVLALVGAGIQAGYQLEAHLDLYSFDSIRVWGFQEGEAQNFVKRRATTKNLIPCLDVESCVQEADIVITCTSSRGPLVKRGWLKPGVHINAIGADAKGKQELDPEILLNSRIIVDDWEQASHSGEINVPISEGLLTRGSVYGDLSEVVSGQKEGRENPAQMTVFDSTGLAALDIYFAGHVYDQWAKRS